VTRLEERYRRVLKLLPAPYREVWEEDMVATFLAGVVTDDPEANEFAADYGRPSWPEVVSGAALAVRLRLGGAGAPPRYAVWGAAVRRAVLICLLVNAASSAVGLIFTLWLAGRLPLLAPPSEEVLMASPAPTLWQLAGLLWLPGYLLLVFGQTRAARWLAAVAVASSLITIVLNVHGPAVAAWFNVALDAVVVAGLAAFRADTPPVARRPWLVGLALAIGVVSGYLVLTPFSEGIPALDWAGLCCVAVALAGLAHLVTRALGWTARISPWTPALVLLAVAALGQRAAASLDLMWWHGQLAHPLTRPLGLVETLAVVAVGMPLAVISARTSRRLPAKPVDPAGVGTW